MIHHGMIRKYTTALLSIFNGLEIEYKDSLGVSRVKKVPIQYSSKEKAHLFDSVTTEQLLSGNYNVLPRASLTLSTMIKSDERSTNKNLKIGVSTTGDTLNYMYNNVPYEFTYEVVVQCRGMNEATMIIEQVAPMFNPTYNVDINEVQNINEPTRVPITLLDIGIETEEYEELSSNIISVNFGLSIKGNIYPTINEVQKIKDFKIYINELSQNSLFYDRKDVLGWDVIDTTLENGTLTVSTDISGPNIITIVGSVVEGENDITCIYEDADNQISELTFEWSIVSGDASIVGDLDNAVLTMNDLNNVEVQLRITDIYGNFDTRIQDFIV